MSITIRPIAATDREAWQRLFTDYGVFYETAFDEKVLEGVWVWLMDAAHPTTALVAVVGDSVVGFAHVREQPDTFTAGPGWYLDDLYVSPAARGTGAGSALIAAIEARAAEAGGGTIRWITAADNATAQRVYDKVATRTTWVTYEKEVG